MLPSYIQGIIDKLDAEDGTVLKEIRELHGSDMVILLETLKGDRDLYRKALAEAIKREH